MRSAETATDFSHRETAVHESLNLGIIQLPRTPTAYPAFSRHVNGVSFRITKEEMVGVTADAIIALVKNPCALRNRAI